MTKISKTIFLVLLCFAFTAFTVAQTQPNEPAAHENSASPSTPSAESSAQGSHSESAEAGEAKNGEAHEAEKDEEAQFKESGSVKWLAKTLGIAPTQAYWVSWILNFVIIAALIVFALKSSLPTLFRERTAAIQKGMEEARRASAEASARLTEIESRLARLGVEINEMRAKSEQDAQAEDERMRAATEDERRKIVENSEQEIAAAANAARRDLKQFAAELAISLAEKKISVNDTTDQALIRYFAAHLADGSGSTSPKGGR
jgi:F-type H+-transporting ATPase subunit b